MNTNKDARSGNKENSDRSTKQEIKVYIIFKKLILRVARFECFGK